MEMDKDPSQPQGCTLRVNTSWIVLNYDGRLLYQLLLYLKFSDNRIRVIIFFYSSDWMVDMDEKHNIL